MHIALSFMSNINTSKDKEDLSIESDSIDIDKPHITSSTSSFSENTERKRKLFFYFVILLNTIFSVLIAGFSNPVLLGHNISIILIGVSILTITILCILLWKKLDDVYNFLKHINYTQQQLSI